MISNLLLCPEHQAKGLAWSSTLSINSQKPLTHRTGWYTAPPSPQESHIRPQTWNLSLELLKDDLKEFEYIQFNPFFNPSTTGMREVHKVTPTGYYWGEIKNERRHSGRNSTGIKSDKVTFLGIEKRLRGGYTIFLTIHPVEKRGPT